MFFFCFKYITGLCLCVCVKNLSTSAFVVRCDNNFDERRTNNYVNTRTGTQCLTMATRALAARDNNDDTTHNGDDDDNTTAAHTTTTTDGGTKSTNFLGPRKNEYYHPSATSLLTRCTVDGTAAAAAVVSVHTLAGGLHEKHITRKHIPFTHKLLSRACASQCCWSRGIVSWNVSRARYARV